MNKFFYQAFHTLASKAVLLVIAFTAGVVLARLLGPEGRGQLALFLVVPSLVMSFGEFGIRQSAAFLIGQKEHPLRDIQASMMALCVITTILGVLLVALAFQLQGLLGQAPAIAAVCLAMVPVGLLRRYLAALQLGNQEIEKLNNVQVLDSAGNLLFVVILVGVLDLSVAGAAGALFGAHAVSLAYTLWLVRDRVSLRARWVSPLPQTMLKIGFFYGLSLLVLNLNYRIDILVLGHMRDEASVGIYTTGVGISELLRHVPLSIGLVLFSRSIQLKGAVVQERLKHVTQLCRINFVFAICLALAVAGLSWWMVPMVYGPSFEESTQVIWILLPGAVMLTFFITLQLFVAGQGRPGLALLAFGPALVINMCLNLLFIPQWNYLGSALASSISYSLATLIFIVIFCRYYHVSMAEVLVPRPADVMELWGWLRQMHPALRVRENR